MAEALTPLARRRVQLRRLRRFLLAPLIIFGAILGALFAYSGLANPLYVVESNSMQHSGDTSHIGVLDTGDIFVAQAVNAQTDVITYLEGRARGHETYGDFGDVIVFHDPELLSSSPIVHRAIGWVTWNESAGGYDVPDLSFLNESEWTAYDAGGAETTTPYGLSRFVLHRAGWTRTEDVLVNLTWIISRRGIALEGFLTSGDYNVYRLPVQHDPWVLPMSLVIGKARGEVPWFGLIRLSLAPSPQGCCEAWSSTDPDRGAPANSWAGLHVSLGILIGLPAVWTGVDWYLDRHPAIRDRWALRWRQLRARIGRRGGEQEETRAEREKDRES